MRHRIPKTVKQKLHELDDELYLLRRDLLDLKEDLAHIRSLATRLRNLACESSGTEGLLWRLAKELGVSDEIELIAFGSVNRDSKFAKGLEFFRIPLHRPGQGPPSSVRAEQQSLKHVIKECEAIYVPNFSDKILTHEWLIKEVSQQIGSAHVDDGISPSLRRIINNRFDRTQSLIKILAFDAELTLQIGERVLDEAISNHQYIRSKRVSEIGDVSIIVRLQKRDEFAGEFHLVAFRSAISEIDIEVSCAPNSLKFKAFKRGLAVGKLSCSYPVRWDDAPLSVFAFEYSSNSQQASLITNGLDQGRVTDQFCLGWLSASEICPVTSKSQLDYRGNPFFEIGGFIIYSRFLTTEDQKLLRREMLHR